MTIKLFVNGEDLCEKSIDLKTALSGALIAIRNAEDVPENTERLSECPTLSVAYYMLYNVIIVALQRLPYTGNDGLVVDMDGVQFTPSVDLDGHGTINNPIPVVYADHPDVSVAISRQTVNLLASAVLAHVMGHLGHVNASRVERNRINTLLTYYNMRNAVIFRSKDIASKGYTTTF